jgi:serine/threonine protein phosphatase PrpC
MISYAEIGDLLASCNGDVQECARRLVDKANEAGGRDNVSVVVVGVQEAPNAQ